MSKEMLIVFIVKELGTLQDPVKRKEELSHAGDSNEIHRRRKNNANLKPSKDLHMLCLVVVEKGFLFLSH